MGQATIATAQPFPEPWQPAETWFADGWVFTPGFSPDGQTAWITTWADPLNLAKPQELYRMERDGDSWRQPEKIDIAPGQLLDWPSVSPDEKTLFISIAQTRFEGSVRIDDFDLYTVPIPVAGPVSDAPQPIRDDGINTIKTRQNATVGYAANETGPRLLADGTLVFWTQREGATGWRDIFFADPVPEEARKEQGGMAWQRPYEFALNTEQRDSHPFLPPSGDYILFTSSRPGGYGGDDLYYAERLGDGSWSEPCNLGPRINGPYDDGAAVIDPATGDLIFGSNRPRNVEQGYRLFITPINGDFCE